MSSVENDDVRKFFFGSIEKRKASSNSAIRFESRFQPAWSRFVSIFSLKENDIFFSNFSFAEIRQGGLVISYVIIGGLIFDAIESRHESEILVVKKQNRQRFVDQLYVHAYREFNRVLNQTFELKYALWRGGLSRNDERNDGWQIKVEKGLWKDFVDLELLHYFGAEEKNQYRNDQDQEQNTVQVWTFASAMLYSATVITTIGYGNITPKTTEGKIATMVRLRF